MAESPVIVPVELQVTDLDMSKINIKDVQKSLDSKLSGIRQSVQKIFANMDTSNLNNSIITSMDRVQGSIEKAQLAQLKLNEAMIKAGKSSDEFKTKMALINSEIANTRGMIAQYQQFGKAGLPYLNEAEQKLANLIKQKDQMNPIDFVASGQPAEVQKVAFAFNKVLKTMTDVNKQAEHFNEVTRKNTLTDEYQQDAAEAEKLRGKLEELNDKSKKMAELGATDKQWASLQYDAKKLSSEIGVITTRMREAVKSGQAFRFGVSDADIQEQLKAIRSINGARNANKGAINQRANANMSIYSESYTQELEALDKMNTKVQALIDKYEKFKALGGSSKSLESMRYDADKLEQEISEARAKLQGMIRDGTAFKLGTGDTDSEMANINARLGEMSGRLTQIHPLMQRLPETIQSAFGKFATTLSSMGPKISQLSPVVAKIGDALSGAVIKVLPVLNKIAPALKIIGKIGLAVGKIAAKGMQLLAKGAQLAWGAVKKLASALGNVASKLVSCIKHFKLFGKAGHKTSDSMGKSFKKLGRRVLMFGFGFRSLYYLVKRLRKVFIDSFRALAAQSDEVNQQISGLVTAFNQLKGTLATAFQPIAAVLIPILKTLLGYLTAALQALGKFSAVLTGQGYIYKASAAQKDYAESLKKTGGAAKDAQKSLMGFDEINRLDSDKNGGGAGTGDGLEFEQEKINPEDAISKFAEAVKRGWEAQDFTEVGDIIEAKALSVLTRLETSIVPKVASFVNRLAQSIYTLLASIDFTSIGNAVASNLNTIMDKVDFNAIGQVIGQWKNALWGFLDGLINDIDWAMLGTSLANAITGIFSAIDFEHIANILSGLANGLGTALSNMVQNVDWASVATSMANAVNKLFADFDPTILHSTITNFMNSLLTFVVTWVQNIDWTNVKAAIKSGIDSILTGLQEAMSGSDITTFQLFGDLMGAIKESLDTVWPVIDRIAQAIQPILDALLPVVTTILPPITELLTTVADMVLPVIVTLIETVSPIIQELAEAILPCLQEILESLQPFFDVLVDTVLPFFADILDAIMPLIDGILQLVTDILTPIGQLLGPLTELVVNLLQPILTILKPIFQVLGFGCDLLGTLLKPILELLTPLTEILNAILTPINTILEAIMALLDPFIDLIMVIGTTVEGLVEVPLHMLVGIMDTISGAIGFLSDIVTSACESMSEVFQSWADSAKSVFNSVLGFIESIVNGIIRGINWCTRALNNLSFDVPDWVPGIGGETFGFNIAELSQITIPRLAQGAVIPPNNEFLAMLGDQKSGTNIEAPLSTIKQAVGEEMAEYIEAMIAGFEAVVTAIDNKDMDVSIGDTVIGKAAERYNRRQHLARGRA